VHVSRDCPVFLKYALLSQEWVKLLTSDFAATFTRSIPEWRRGGHRAIGQPILYGGGLA